MMTMSLPGGPKGRPGKKTGTEVWWVSSPRMTVKVKIDSDRQIIEAAPVVRKFVGQSFSNLIGWIKKQGQIQMYNI